MVLRPDTDPQIARAVLDEPVHDLGEQALAGAAVLEGLQEVEPLQFAAGRGDLGMGQAAGTGQGEAHRLVASLHQPEGLGRIGQIDAGLVDVVAGLEEGREVSRTIEVAEGLGEGRPADGDDGVGIAGVGAADVEFGHSFRLQNG